MMARLVARFCRPYGAWVCLGGFPRAAPSFAMANSGLPWANVLRSRWELGDTELADRVFANRPAMPQNDGALKGACAEFEIVGEVPANGVGGAEESKCRSFGYASG